MRGSMWSYGRQKLLKWFPVLGFLIIICISCAHSRSNRQKPCNVGYKVIDMVYHSEGQVKTVTVAVWYPTMAQPEPFTYGGPTKGNVAPEARPYAESGPYPLLVFSHGYGGSGIGAVFFTEALAALGWIVAAPDHNDRYSAVRIRSGQQKDFDRQGFFRHAKEISTSGPKDRGKYQYRIDEMKLVLNGMITSDLFGSLIDKDHIAVGGHSFGGFTALGVCGTIKEHSNSHIRAVLLYSSGAGGYLFSGEELAAVRIPSMYFLGEQEKEQMRGESTMGEIADKVHRNLPPPKYFLEVKGANHFSFNNSLSETYTARFLSGSEEQFSVIRRYSIAFLEAYVAGKKDAEQILSHDDPMLTRYLREITPGRQKK